MSVQMTLADKVYNQLSIETLGGGSPFDFAGKFPHHGGEFLTQFELDCHDWGVAYGIAHGIARGEDPFESNESVGQRALAAARDAYSRVAGSDIFTRKAFDADRAERPVPVEPDAEPVA